jgi:hypothetical protein
MRLAEDKFQQYHVYQTALPLVFGRRVGLPRATKSFVSVADVVDFLRSYGKEVGTVGMLKVL